MTDKITQPENRSGVGLIWVERQRQISDEDYTAEHDDSDDGFHEAGQLARAAASYANAAGLDAQTRKRMPGDWPWNPGDYHGDCSAVRMLVKAGALIAAEIDRRLRKGESV